MVKERVNGESFPGVVLMVFFLSFSNRLSLVCVM